MEGFFGIGFQELVMIAIVALIVLGPERLPATLREVAKFIRQVRNLTSEFTQQFGDDFKALEDLDPRRMLQQAITSIDEEEQAKEGATKGKSTTAKPTSAAKTTPAKTTPAKTTPAKTTATTTTKPASSTPVTATAGKSTAIPKSTTPAPAKETAATDSTGEPQANAEEKKAATETIAPAANATTSLLDPAETPENQQRIVPPELVKSVQEQPDQAETSASATTPAIQANGKDNEHPASAPVDAGAIVAEEGSGSTPATNGNQDH